LPQLADQIKITIFGLCDLVDGYVILQLRANSTPVCEAIEMFFEKLAIKGPLVIRPSRMARARMVQRDLWPDEFVDAAEDFPSCSTISRCRQPAGTARGLHFQIEPWRRAKWCAAFAASYDTWRSIFDVRLHVKAASDYLAVAWHRTYGLPV
jgi:hypothetical protein